MNPPPHASATPQRPRPSPSRPSPHDPAGLTPRRRPATIAELADRARDDQWDPSKGVKHWLKTGEGHRRAGKHYADANDLENAFVEFAKAATIVLEKLPSHREYHTTLNPEQKHNLGLNGQDILDSLSSLKPTLVERYDRWISQHPDDDTAQPSPGPSTSAPYPTLRRAGRPDDPYARAQEDARKEQQIWYERDLAAKDEARRKAQEDLDRRQREDIDKRRREIARREEEQQQQQQQQQQWGDQDSRRKEEAVAAAWRAAGAGAVQEPGYYAPPQDTAAADAQRQLDFERQQAEMKKREEEIRARRQNDIAKQRQQEEQQQQQQQPPSARPPPPPQYPIPRGLGPSRVPSFPDQQLGGDLPIPMPLESPTRHEDEYSTDRESVNDGQAPWQHRGRGQPSGTPTRAPVRAPSYPPPITTTSPAPDSRPVRYPSLMSQHQLKQGYAPSLQSMFINSGGKAPMGSTSLLFVPENPASSSSLYPSNALPRPSQPSHYPYGPPPPQQQQQQPSTSPYATYPGPTPDAPRSAPTLHEDTSRIALPTARADPVVVELKNVTVPRDCLPKFLSIAALNTSRNRETCGLLLGKDKGHKFAVTTLLIPKQHSTSDTCTMDEEELVMMFTEERSLITLGWIHTHPSQSCFMSSVDLHTHSGFQRMLPESFAVVCAPKSTPNFGIFRLTDPPGLQTILDCNAKEAFHPHPDLPIYTDADKGHIQMRDLPLEIVDLRS